MDVLIAAQVVCLPFECNLCDPFSGFLILVDTFMTACIVGSQFIACFFQDHRGGSIKKLEILFGCFFFQTSTASGFPAEQTVLLNDYGIAALAAALPLIDAFFFFDEAFHCQPAKFLASQICTGSFCFSAFAAGTDGPAGQPGCRDIDRFSTAAATFPDGTAIGSLIGWFQNCKFPNSESRQILLAGTDPALASTVGSGLSLNPAGIHFYGISAAAAAFPDCISIFLPVRFTDDSQISKLISKINFFLTNVESSFPGRFTASSISQKKRGKLSLFILTFFHFHSSHGLCFQHGCMHLSILNYSLITMMELFNHPACILSIKRSDLY